MPEQEQKVLRVTIGEAWTSNEFADFLRATTDIYAVCTLFVGERQGEPEMRLLQARDRRGFRISGRRLSRLLDRKEQLYVKRIHYSSPGFADLAGVAAVLVPLLPFLLKLIELATDRERRQEEVKKLRIENASALIGFAENLRDRGFNSEEVSKILRSVDAQQGKLLKLAQKGKIRKAELVDEVHERENSHDRTDYDE